MALIYRLFRPEVVRDGDTYLVGIGGFSTQVTKVSNVNAEGFTYRNSLFVSSHDFRDGLDGILQRTEGDKIVFYLNEFSYKKLKESSPEMNFED